MDDSFLLLSDAILHVGERRRERKRGYYVTGVACGEHSGLNLIFNRPKRKRKCPYCGNTLSFVSEVDEFELARIKSWAGDNLIIIGGSRA